ncbi:MAG: EamA family transporter, partial [Acidimicrobiia bacterium]
MCAAIPFAVTALIVLLRHSYRASTPWLEALALGGVNAAVPALLFNFGFNRLPASIVTLAMASGPVFTALTAHIAFHDDRFSGAKVTGLALSFSGVVLLAGLPADGGNGSPIAFVVTLIGAALSGASLV